jgi:hypothetical protein
MKLRIKREGGEKGATTWGWDERGLGVVFRKE